MTFSWSRGAAPRLLVIMAVALALATPARGEDAVSYTRVGATYADVRFELESAIINEGLKIDQIGNVAAMLQRTGPDVGSTKSIYLYAEYFTFCSAKLSRAMMEADPANLSQCPYVMFIYQRAEAKDVVVGYRKLAVTGRGAASFEEVNRLLDKIARAASR